MKRIHDHETESRVATGIKTAALVVLLGLIAVVAHPQRMSDEVIVSHAALSTTEAAPRITGAASEDYYDTHYPHPTRVEDQPPTF
jgi:hypothetical protein